MMTNTALAERQGASADVIEQVLVNGDISKLNPAQRVEYYRRVCESVGLNPLTQPLSYITLNGRLTLYAKRDATDQLRKIHNVSVVDMEETEHEGVHVVKVKVRDADGREDVAKGAVNISGLKGDALANAMLKAETKAKRRATLSICGLGFLDETEVETIPEAARNGKRTREEISAEANRKRQELRDAQKDIEQIESLAELDRYEREVLTPEFMAGLGMKQYAVEEAFQRRKNELEADQDVIEEIEEEVVRREINYDEATAELLRDELVERIEAAETAEDLIRFRDTESFRSIFARLPKDMQTTVRRHGQARLEKLPAGP